MSAPIEPPLKVTTSNTGVEKNVSLEDYSAPAAAPILDAPIEPPPLTPTPGSVPTAAPTQLPALYQMHPAAIDIWSTRVASWAQVVTAIVVIIGYFYTVRPAFQFQLLQEQAAQLQIDNEAAKKNLAQTIVAQESAQTKLSKLDEELARVAKTRDDLTAQLNRESQLESRAMELESQAMQRMQSAQAQLSAEAAAHLITQRRLLYTRFWNAFSWGLSFGLLVYMHDVDPDGTYFSEVQAAWPERWLGIFGQVDKWIACYIFPQ